MNKYYIKDWEVHDESKPYIAPEYNAGLNRYTLSMETIVDSLNNAGYPLNGEIIEVPDGQGGRVPLVDKLDHIINDTAHLYRLETFSTAGNIIKDQNFKSILRATLYKNNKDITDQIDEKYFKWTRRTSEDPADMAADAEWNLRWSQGAKEIPITNEDINNNAVFNCFYVTEVDEIMWVRKAYDEYRSLDYHKYKQDALRKKEEYKNAICKF